MHFEKGKTMELLNRLLVALGWSRRKDEEAEPRGLLRQ
jgi:hypothetical protein